MSPPSARPSPFSRPCEFRMLDRAIWPQMIAGIAPKTLKQKYERTPRTRLVIARPEVSAPVCGKANGWAAACGTVPPKGGGVAAGALTTEESATQEGVPSTHA